MDRNKEYILCAAIWYPDDSIKPSQNVKNIDKGIVICAYRHNYCVSIAAASFYPNWRDDLDNFNEEHDEMGIKLNNIKIEGFLTSKNRFVDREEGAKIAIESNQVKKLKYSSKELYSEDLY